MAFCFRYSNKLFKIAIDSNILDQVKELLPSVDDVKNHNYLAESFPQAIEVVNFIESLLPEKEDQLKEES